MLSTLPPMCAAHEWQGRTRHPGHKIRQLYDMAGCGPILVLYGGKAYNGNGQRCSVEVTGSRRHQHGMSTNPSASAVTRGEFPTWKALRHGDTMGLLQVRGHDGGCAGGVVHDDNNLRCSGRLQDTPVPREATVVVRTSVPRPWTHALCACTTGPCGLAATAAAAVRASACVAINPTSRRTTATIK